VKTSRTADHKGFCSARIIRELYSRIMRARGEPAGRPAGEGVMQPVTVEIIAPVLTGFYH